MVAWRSGSASALQALGRGFKSLSDHQVFDGSRVFRGPFFLSAEDCSRLDGSSGLPVFRRRRARFLPGFCKVFSISRLVSAEKWRVFRDLLPGFCALFRKS